MVRGVVAWVTPKRLKLYPAAMVISVLGSGLWLIISGLNSGVPFALTLGQDFKGYYTGGRFFVDGRISELYDFDAQKDFQASLAIPENRLLPFIHPPFSVVLWAPFALGSYLTGLLLWWACGLLALAVSLRLLRQELAPSSVLPTGRLLMLSFLFYPALAWFLFGQNTAFTLLIYTLTFVLLRRGRDLAAGATLGLLLYKPQLAIALGVMLAVKGRWWTLLGGAVSAGLWLAIGFALSPVAMQDYARISPGLLDLELSLADPGSKLWAVHTFYAFAVLLLDGIWPEGGDIPGIALTTGGLILVVAWWWRTAWRPGTRAWDLRVAATIALGLLISPYLFHYDLMLLLLPLAIVWSHYSAGTTDRPLDGGPLLAWTVLLYGAVFASNLISAAQLRLSEIVGLPRIAVQLSVPVIFGWAWLVSRLAQR